MTVSNLLCEIINHEFCPGLPLEPMQGEKVSHVIPCDLKSHLPVSTKMFSRNDERRVVHCMDSKYMVAQKN